MYVLISTNDGKHRRASMRIGGRCCNSRNRPRPLPPRHSTHADVHDD
jgi:hypothetical protein